MQFKRAKDKELDVNLTPLIDVVFLLLIFFMVSTTFTDKLELAVDLPKADAQVQLKKTDAIEVVITAKGDFTINGKTLLNAERRTVKGALQTIANGETHRPVIITADENAPHKLIVRVMDAAGQLGFNNLSITAIEYDG
ncbi:MAG: biopolymer transporter ExbD [Cellvibrionales bacterium]|nr:biopolymer transporter ExbD [Cellvibrionales bacterium]